MGWPFNIPEETEETEEGARVDGDTEETED